MYVVGDWRGRLKKGWEAVVSSEGRAHRTEAEIRAEVQVPERSESVLPRDAPKLVGLGKEVEELIWAPHCGQLESSLN